MKRRIIEHYEIIRKLGSGGSGTVSAGACAPCDLVHFRNSVGFPAKANFAEDAEDTPFLILL